VFDQHLCNQTYLPFPVLHTAGSDIARVLLAALQQLIQSVAASCCA
jgi:hypothetical protein